MFLKMSLSLRVVWIITSTAFIYTYIFQKLIYYFCIDYMWLHIRAVGEWTNSLYSYFEKEQIKLHCANILPAENCDTAPRKKS